MRMKGGTVLQKIHHGKQAHFPLLRYLGIANPLLNLIHPLPSFLASLLYILKRNICSNPAKKKERSAFLFLYNLPSWNEFFFLPYSTLFLLFCIQFLSFLQKKKRFPSSFSILKRTLRILPTWMCNEDNVLPQ